MSNDIIHKDTLREVAKLFSLNGSTTLIIPTELAQHYKFHKGNRVILEGRENGILVRTLDLGEK
jgi:hypothetical protein